VEAMATSGDAELARSRQTAAPEAILLLEITAAQSRLHRREARVGTGDQWAHENGGTELLAGEARNMASQADRETHAELAHSKSRA
jgi:hypothetical protein